MSVNFFLYGSNLGIFHAFGFISFVCLKDNLCNGRQLLRRAVSLSHVSLLQHIDSDLTATVSGLTAVLSELFCPKAKPCRQSKAISPINFFIAIIFCSETIYKQYA